jgi:ABC-2 type transport system permease protein
MNPQAIQILFLKDLFLSRWALCGYLIGGLLSALVTCLPGQTFGFIGFILIVTVTIAAGIHLIGMLLLSEPIEMTRTFIMSLPVSLLDYSIAKISVVLVAFLIPWVGMLACLTVLTFIVPGAKAGVLVLIVLLFMFMMGGFSLQLVTAVITQSVGWTIVMVVLGNVLFNLFAKFVNEHPVIAEIAKGDSIAWPPVVLQILAVEAIVVIAAIAFAFVWQSRRRDLV